MNADTRTLVVKLLGLGTMIGLSGFLFVISPAISQPPAAAQPDRAPGMVTSFAPVVEKVAPSVVSVRTSKTVKVPRALRDFFGVPGQEVTRGLGSGVIVSEDGYILTNRHVIEDADEIIVGMGIDGKEYKAKKIGVDPGTDVGVLKIDAKGLPQIPFADSDKAKVGDVVLAVGNPFGLTQTVTMGIISGVGRGGMGIVDYENFIQTDASINPGNSGGALVDTTGRLVGLNTAIFSRSGGNMGIGFAVPSNLAVEVLKSIRERGRVVRGYLGTVIQPVTPELAEAFKFKGTGGALVSEVSPTGPADKAGIQHGDVITEVNGKKVAGPRELRLIIGGLAPGATVPVKLIRNGEEKVVQVQLGELPQKESAISSGGGGNEPSQAAGPATILDGITVGDLNNENRQAIQAPAGLQGAIVTAVDSDSPGYSAGIRQGQVIEEINRQPVKNAAEAVRLSEALKKGESVLLRVWSEGQSRYVTVGEKE
ncbi:MAG: Do family serine endopeptidase [Verrucomicrobiota bacterium]